MHPKFKPGDRIKFVGGEGLGFIARPGATGTVGPQVFNGGQKFNDKWVFFVVWDKLNPLVYGQTDNYAYEEYFELENPPVPIDVSKPIRTRAGWEVTSATEMVDPERPIQAVVHLPNGNTPTLSFDKFGSFYPKHEQDIDLVNI